MLLKYALLAVCAVASCLAASPKIRRPCHFTNLKCIGDNLAANSYCKKNVAGKIPHEYTIKNFKFDTPFFNSTYIEKELTIRNQDQCRVSEFYFNLESDVCVLAIDCPLLDFESDRTLVQHYSLKEDTSYHYHIRCTYPLIRLTTTLSHAERLDLCSAYTFADVTALPIFRVDPKDKPTANFLTRDLTHLNIYERETFFYRGSQLAREFVNKLICDFGCK